MLVAGVLLLAGVLTAAGTSKLMRPAPFRAALGRLVPARLARPLALGVPALELALGAALALGPAARPAVAGAALLLLGFSGALAVLAMRGQSGCACFGDSDAAQPATGLARNAALLTVAVAVLLIPGTAAPLSVGPGELTGAATVALGAVCLWMLGQALIGAGFRAGSLWSSR